MRRRKALELYSDSNERMDRGMACNGVGGVYYPLFHMIFLLYNSIRYFTDTLLHLAFS